MAPELALATLDNLRPNSVVLDPMSGSGTVIRQAAELGHRAFGFDMDPLAVLMSRVWTKSVADDLIKTVADQLFDEIERIGDQSVVLPWIDDDPETSDFIDFWFGSAQKIALRKIAFVLDGMTRRRFSGQKKAAIDVIKVALSRIIITKEQAASLARDTSHSRPHKVSAESDFEVLPALMRSIAQIRKRLLETPTSGASEVNLGDARKLKSVGDNSVDLVLTSPPYLNAIDYLRGHRLSLVWLGFRISNLRGIRSTSIGAERAPDKQLVMTRYQPIWTAMCDVEILQRKHVSMIHRYSEDLYRMMSEVARVVKREGTATFVVGNSCLKGNFIQNSAGVEAAAVMNGMRTINSFERDLPVGSRYLPTPAGGSLGKRMRTETILTFGHA
ncbi:hypothetical protein SAMN05428948_2788 [Massilia sp. CF038]|nr:hypothetical protein SAMN05428948_2788 [Massilia sp. CF038]